MKKNNYQKPTMQVVKIQKTAFLLYSDPEPGSQNAPEFIGVS